MDAPLTDVEQSFSAAYRQKFLELLKKNCSSLTPSEKGEVCDFACGGDQIASEPARTQPGGVGVPSGATAPKTPSSCKKPWLFQFIVFALLLGAIAYVGYLLYGIASKTQKNLFGQAIVQIDDGLSYHHRQEITSGGIEIPASAATIPQGKTIIMFHSERCGHCKKAAPIFMQLSKQFAKATLKMCDDKCLAALPAEQRKEINLEGFPTFCSFNNGKLVSKQVGAPGGAKEMADMCDRLI